MQSDIIFAGRAGAMAFAARSALQLYLKQGSLHRLPIRTFAAVFAGVLTTRTLLRKRLEVLKRTGREYGLAAVAGAAGAALLCLETPGAAANIALYAGGRALHTLWNLLLPGVSVPFGAELTFILSTAQIMNSYAVKPDLLPTNYYWFIQRMGPIPEPTLEMVRASAVLGVGERVECSLLHPGEPSCARNAAAASLETARKCVRLYTGIHVTSLLWHAASGIMSRRKERGQQQEEEEEGKKKQGPVSVLVKAVMGVGQSTAFLASLCGLYMASICAHRNLFRGDSQVAYYVAGLVSGSAIFIEKAARRTELALFTFPRAVASLGAQAGVSLPGLEFVLASLTAAILIHARENGPADSLSSSTRTAVNLIFGQQ